MKRFFSEMNPMIRGFLVIALIALIVVVLQLYQTLAALSILARIAFLLAIAFFVYLVWRDKRHGISMWPPRAQWVFYGGAALVVADIAAWYRGFSGYDDLGFVLVIVFCVYAMVRTWREQHTYRG